MNPLAYAENVVRGFQGRLDTVLAELRQLANILKPMAA